MEIFKKFRSLLYRYYIRAIERKWQNSLAYLFFPKNADSLLIIFSGFDAKGPRYNYLRNMSIKGYDRLYILDPFGYTGSYNLFENGSDHPRILTESLINHFICNGKYKHVYTAGSSKGGTCAIYFGLGVNADAILAGACQYNIGSFVHREDHERIFLGMMGRNAGDKEARILDSIMPELLEKHKGCSTVIHLLYSKNELTYQRQIIDLIAKMRECSIPFIEQIEDFDDHGMVGHAFLPYMKRTLEEYRERNSTPC